MQLSIDIRNDSAKPLIVFVMTALLMQFAGCAIDAESQNGDTPELTELIVLSQSIGRGVPETTQQKFDSIKQLLKSKGLEIHVSMWGIEGEQRLCVVMSKQQLAQLTPDIEKISEGVPLLEVTYRRAPAKADKYCEQ